MSVSVCGLNICFRHVSSGRFISRILNITQCATIGEGGGASYGIAIDINTEYSNYWLWTNQGAGELDTLKYENRIPREIVEIFERHGFIWGGHWYHYDTMHFEYRPEILGWVNSFLSDN